MTANIIRGADSLLQVFCVYVIHTAVARLRTFRTNACPAIAALLLVHVLAVLALAASPSLHHWLHADADDDDHDCAVMLFVHGAGQAGSAPLAAPAFVGWAMVLTPLIACAPAGFVESAYATGRVFEHGPPPVG